MLRRVSAVTILVTLLGSPSAAAQRCLGFHPFQSRPVQVSVGSQFQAGLRRFDGGVTLGSSSVFGGMRAGARDMRGTLLVGTMEILDFAGSMTTLGGVAGVRVPLARGSVEWCPVAALDFVSGPKDINGSTLDYSERDVSFGAAFGVVATSNAQFEIVPTGSIAYAKVTTKLVGSSGTYTKSPSYGVVGLGVGFLFGRQVSVTPSVARPFGVSGASTIVGITVSFRLGGAPVVRSAATSCAGLVSTDSIIYDTTEVAERPRLRQSSEPWYPHLEREAGWEGRVILAVVVGPDGTPEGNSVRVVQDLDSAFDAAARTWILRVSYWPACRDGRPVRALIAQPVDFCAYGCHRRKQ